MCFLKKMFLNQHPQLKAVIDKFALFSDKPKSVLRLNEDEMTRISQLRMLKEELAGGDFKEDAMQAFLKLFMIESMKVARNRNPKPDQVTKDYSHIHHFFELLEK